jgi:hypothetical protein
MTWQPGKPVVTAQDNAEWRIWRKSRKLEQQRARRRGLRRIDYEARPEARALLTHLQQRHWPVGVSAVLDAIVARWISLWLEGKEPDLW